MSDDSSNEGAEWGLVDPFETDDGSLNGLDPGVCFALGVEWCMLREQMKRQKHFRTYVTIQGVERIARMAERHGRFVEWNPAHECKGWALITVGTTKEQTP